MLTLRRSREVTPPLDEEKEKEDSLWREAEARKKLEADGCPPCYPPGVDVDRLQDTSEPCRAIVGYWQSFAWTEDMPLCSQLKEWNRFRAYQKRKRLRSFEIFEHEVRQRQRRHGFDDDVLLTMDLDQQSPLDRWIEFQNYELARFEQFEKELDHEKEREELKKKLPESRTAHDIHINMTHCVIRPPVELAERQIRLQMVLLDWIEQQRQSMRLGENATATSNEMLVQEPEPEPVPNNAVVDNSDVKPRRTATRRRPKPRSTNKRYRIRRSKDHSLIRRQLRLQRVTESKSRSRGLA